MTALMQFYHRPEIRWHRTWRCALCRGSTTPMFSGPDDVWRFYVEHEQRHRAICIGCWKWLVEVIDDGAYQAQHGGPVGLWSPEHRAYANIPPEEKAPKLWPGFTHSAEALAAMPAKRPKPPSKRTSYFRASNQGRR